LPLNSTPCSSTVESLRRCPPVNLRLASPIDLPALPDEPNLRLLGCRISGAAFRLTIDLRLRSAFQLPSGQNSSACASARPSGCLPINLPLSLPINLPAKPSNRIFDFRLRSTFRFRLRTQPPTYCVSSVEKDFRSAQPVHASANLSISVHISQRPHSMRTFSIHLL